MEVKIYLENNDFSKESFTFPYESEHPINTYFYLCNYYCSYRAQGASTTARSLWRHVLKLNFKARAIMPRNDAAPRSSPKVQARAC